MAALTYPKNFRAHGYGWHRQATAASAVHGFLKGERGEKSDSGYVSLYPKLPGEDDSVFSVGTAKLYPSLPAEEYESGEVEAVEEESCEAVNVNLMRCLQERIEK